MRITYNRQVKFIRSIYTSDSMGGAVTVESVIADVPCRMWLNGNMNMKVSLFATLNDQNYTIVCDSTEETKNVILGDLAEVEGIRYAITLPDNLENQFITFQAARVIG
jgi:hypothetical protein